MGSRRRGKRPVKEVRADVLAALSQKDGTEALKASLEELSNELAFGGLTHLWGPALYKLAPKVHRQFILRHFSTYLVGKNWSYQFVPWKGEPKERLEEWLQMVDEADDVELFKRLYAWKQSNLGHKKAGKAWQKELLTRLRKAKDRAARQTVLNKFDTYYWLDEETAIGLYQCDHEVVSSFIIKHLPKDYSLFTGEKRKFWAALARLALTKEDDVFYYQLYRQQIPIKTWSRDVLKLARDMKDVDILLEELRKRHPTTWSSDLSEGFCELLKARGEELFPYILPELRRVMRGWFRDGFDKLMKLALQKGWLELWAGLLRTCGKPKEYEKAVLEVVKLSSSEAKKRLRLLAGVGQEWNFGAFGFAGLTLLSDRAAVEVYKRYPEMLRGPLKAQVSPNWNNTYPKLLELLLKHDDEELIDYLASRLITNNGLWGQEKMLKPAEQLARYYEGMQSEPKVFARRAASVLSQVPPYVFWNYKETIRRNRLTRLMYERTAEFYLQDSGALQDLLEAPEIHAQHLAYKALSFHSDEAREQAAHNLPILLGTLLRPLHRRTRLAAFGALKNAAMNQKSAELVVARAREACHLPDKRYPKGELFQLIAELVAKFPELQLPEEQPVIFGASAS